MNVNYLKEMEKTLAALKKSGERKSLLLHSCCAPCSTHVIKLLREAFDLTVYYYNPNVFPTEEYEKRLGGQRKLCALWNIELTEETYDPEEFYKIAAGRASDPEGGQRCRLCCALRLEKTAEKAAALKKDYFATTLSVSPLKNAAALNETGAELEKKYGVKYLTADFKKRDGYLDSVRTSKELGLYRQHYCGCEYSLNKTVKEE